MKSGEINSNKSFIPNEILFEICSFLPIRDIFLRMRCVNKRFYELTNETAFKKMLSQRYIITIPKMLKKNRELVTFLRNCDFKEVTSSGDIKIIDKSNEKSKEYCLNELLKNHIDKIYIPIKIKEKMSFLRIIDTLLEILVSITEVTEVANKFFKKGIEESNEEIKKSVEERFDLDFQMNFVDKAFLRPFKHLVVKNKQIKQSLFNNFKPLLSKYSLDKFPANFLQFCKSI